MGSRRRDKGDSVTLSNGLVRAARIAAVGIVFLTAAVSSFGQDKDLVDRAKAYLLDGKPQAAFDLLEPRADELNDAESAYLLGIAALDIGKAGLAVIALERSLAYDPRYAIARAEAVLAAAQDRTVEMFMPEVVADGVEGLLGEGFGETLADNQVIERIESTSPVRVVSWIGRRMDLNATAVGKERVDHRILSCTLLLMAYNKAPVVLVTKDLNMQLKARAVQLYSQPARWAEAARLLEKSVAYRAAWDAEIHNSLMTAASIWQSTGEYARAEEAYREGFAQFVGRLAPDGFLVALCKEELHPGMLEKRILARIEKGFALDHPL